MLNTITESILKWLSKLQFDLNQTTKTNEKLAILKEAKNEPLSLMMLEYVFDVRFQFGVSSKSIKKRIAMGQPNIGETITSFFELLEKLSRREITGYVALDTCINFIQQYPKYESIILDVLDKDLKARVDLSSVNKAFDNAIFQFDVQLAKSYKDYENKVRFDVVEWLASRKLDGIRCITFIHDDGNIETYSRYGRRFEVLEVLEKDIHETLYPKYKGMVLDGEICVIDEQGNDDFHEMASLIHRKDFSIANPQYRIFDILTKEEFENKEGKTIFSERYKRIDDADLKKSKCIKRLDMWEVESVEKLEELKTVVAQNGWEGLIIKRDIGYQGKRSKDMLKVKVMEEAEFVVVDLEYGDIQYISNGKNTSENMLSCVFIEYKGNRVGVGSGFSIEQRKRFKQHPEEILGKTITVQYFSDSKNKEGKESLRFPVVKFIFENGRDA